MQGEDDIGFLKGTRTFELQVDLPQALPLLWVENVLRFPFRLAGVP